MQVQKVNIKEPTVRTKYLESSKCSSFSARWDRIVTNPCKEALMWAYTGLRTETTRGFMRGKPYYFRSLNMKYINKL